jgi:hypothetical protein
LTPLSNQWRRRRRSSDTHIPPSLLGVLASRDAGMRFMNALISKHEGAGLKSVDEGLILLRCNSKLRVPRDNRGGGGGGRRRWLGMA